MELHPRARPDRTRYHELESTCLGAGGGAAHVDGLPRCRVGATATCLRAHSWAAVAWGVELVHDALGRTEPNAAGTAPTRKVRDTGHRRVAQRVEICSAAHVGVQFTCYLY
jgi:hypothetical protein